MICPRRGCGGKTRVVWTRQDDGDVVRKRVCPACLSEFRTLETRVVRAWVEERSSAEVRI